MMLEKAVPQELNEICKVYQDAIAVMHAEGNDQWRWGEYPHEAMLREDIALDQLAQRIQVNKYYMAHIFSQNYGMSPIQYVQSLRLEESKYLLRTTDFAIKQIASITGFSSLGYFSQRFSKAEGMSPAKYRVMAQNKLIGDLPEETLPARESAAAGVPGLQ